MKDTSQLLVIDDEPLVCRFINFVASQLGFTVTSTGTADDFKNSYMHELPSIIIVDLQMPKVDGVEILRFLAKKKSKASILLISGMDLKTLSTAEYLGRSIGLNMCGVLQKPIVLETLRRALRTTLKEQQHVSVEGLRQAIRNGELEVHYQPVASRNTAGGWTIDGAEALVRWRHPEYGLIMPGRFIEIAEASGLIMSLTDYVLRESIEQHRLWRMAGLECTVSVNLSPLLLANRDFPDYLDKLFAGYGADNSDFVLELTEGEATQDIELTMDVLTRLRLKGIGLSIDDFGTGYSSLKQLFLLPFNELKLDLSFVSRMHDNAEAEKMVKIMIYLAHELGMTSCAEGVESMATLRLLESFGCDKIQGYLISKAVPGEDFLKVSQDWDSQENFPQSLTSSNL